ncbi:hypothetical protein, partial [Megasphaera elsdenii]|uniref:hypothetical protein n=1 Tax=Megasphaera elsdenii TaxID=907 RepID=UPI00195AF18C
TLNQRPRRVLGYHTPSELFDAFLDEVFMLVSVFPDYGCSNSTCNLPYSFVDDGQILSINTLGKRTKCTFEGEHFA